jgi:hypothetical protein
LSIVVLGASGAPGPAQQKSSIPKDIAAFIAAVNLRDPEKRIAELEKFLTQYRISAKVDLYRMTQDSIVRTLVKHYPDRETAILEHARKIMESPNDFVRKNRLLVARNVILPLCQAGILDDFVEEIAVRELRSPDAGGSLYALDFMACLGCVYERRGQLKEAEDQLKLVLTINPQHLIAALAMAELSEKRGEKTAALSMYAMSAALGKIPVAARKQFENLYAGLHNGSTAGLEELVDEQYLSLNPPVSRVEPYQSAAKRTVLIETFTSAASPLCAAADLAMNLAEERYSRGDVVILMYHQHFDDPDPMANAQTKARAEYYKVPWCPMVFVDGANVAFVGTRRAQVMQTYLNLTAIADSRLKINAQAQLKLDVQLEGNLVKARVAIDKLAVQSPDHKLYLVLAEEKLRYMGESGIRFHPMVVRSAAEAGAAQGLDFSAKEIHSIQANWNIKAVSAEIKKHLDLIETAYDVTISEKKHEIDDKNLVVVAFVQNTATRSVLQTALMRVGPRAGSR